MKLYTYFQSSGAYRVRIALNLKKLKPGMAFVDLTRGEHRNPSYAAINPMMMIPSLVDDEGNVLTQSMAIIEYLEEKYPFPALLPLAPLERARVRAIAQAIAVDLAPINNLRVRKYVKQTYGADEKEWVIHWMHENFRPLERMLSLSAQTGRFCHGSIPSMADCMLVPQLFNARRFGCDLSDYPTLVRIDAECNQLPAFKDAHPANQPDAV